MNIHIIPSKPALLLDYCKKYLIVSDLHIGLEKKLMPLQPYTIQNSIVYEMIDELKNIILETNPDHLILLGDIKSSIHNITTNELIDIPIFFNEIQKLVDIIFIPGNHDANLQNLIPNNVTLISSMGMVLNKILLTHGHTLPPKKLSNIDKIIMGHLHPQFSYSDSIMNGQKIWISIKTNKNYLFPHSDGKIEIIVIPSFNKYSFMRRNNHYTKPMSPLFKKMKSVSAKIVTLDGVIIGDESMINYI